MTQQVVVILKNTDYCEGGVHSEVHGVYVDLKSFYDEVKDKGYGYDNEHKFWYTEDEFDNPVYFTEVIQDIKGDINE